MSTANVPRQRCSATKLNRHLLSHSQLLARNLIDSQWYPLTELNKHFCKQQCHSGLHLLNYNGWCCFLVLLTFLALDNGSSGLWDSGKAVSYCYYCFTACCTSTVPDTSIIDKAPELEGERNSRSFKMYFTFFIFVGDISTSFKIHIKWSMAICVSWP